MMNLKNRASGNLFRLRIGSRRGSGLVEFAVALPLLLLVLTGMFTFGVALNNYIMLTEAVAVGGRALAISRGQTTNPCADTATKVAGVAPLLDPTKLKYQIVLNGSTVWGSTPAASPSCSSSSTTTGAAGNLVQGSTAKLVVQYPCKLTVYGVNYAPSGCNMTAGTTEVVQ